MALIKFIVVDSLGLARVFISRHFMTQGVLSEPILIANVCNIVNHVKQSSYESCEMICLMKLRNNMRYS